MGIHSEGMHHHLKRLGHVNKMGRNLRTKSPDALLAHAPLCERSYPGLYYERIKLLINNSYICDCSIFIL